MDVILGCNFVVTYYVAAIENEYRATTCLLNRCYLLNDSHLLNAHEATDT